MIVQMSIIASTYTFCWLSYSVIIQLVTVNLISLSDYYISTFIIFVPYVPSLLTPFICFHIISKAFKFDMIKRIIHYCFPRLQSNVHPQNQNRILNPPKNLIKKTSPV